MHDCLGHPATIQHNTQYNIMGTVLNWDMPATLVHACSLKSTMATYYPYSCLQQLHSIVPWATVLDPLQMELRNLQM